MTSRFSGKITWPGGQLDLGGRTLVMGIINVTPDSFSDGGLYLDSDRAIEHGLQLAQQGADVLDVGGQSTRPGSDPLEPDEQIRRVVPVIRKLTEQTDIPVSIDTDNQAVARAALEAGAGIINDITALRGDPAMAPLAADAKVPVVLMHMQGTPKTMQENPHYQDVTAEVKQFLVQAAKQAVGAGIEPQRIIIDPGIGFGKHLEDNLTLLARIEQLLDTGYAVMAGPSQKRFIGQILDQPTEGRLYGTLGTVGYLAAMGVQMVRVHDVKQTSDVVRIIQAIRQGRSEPAG